MSDCENLREHYEAYALGALEGDERGELESHLARGCPTCTPAVERARWLVAHLAYLAPEVEPPAAMRRRLLQTVRATRSAEPRSWIPVWAWAGAAALALLTIYSLRETRQLQRDLAGLRAQAEAQRSRNQALVADRQHYQNALAILSAANTREIRLKATGNARLPELRAAWNFKLGLVVAAQRIPSPAGDRTYQLWVVPKKGKPISAGIFRPEVGGRVLVVSALEAKISEAAALAVTEEPAGGSSQPTKLPPLWAGPVI